jgi:hypothetical protein
MSSIMETICTLRIAVDSKGKKKKHKCTGKLRYPVQLPDFLGDPNHQMKTERNNIKALQQQKVKETRGCFNVDSLPVSKNFAYFVRTLSTIPEEDWETCLKCVIDHHFDVHDGCGPFCKRKNESEEEKKASSKFYQSTEKDKELYDALYEVMREYLSKERLKEVAHCFDTNANESINNLIAWLAPKNNFLSGSALLKT